MRIILIPNNLANSVQVLKMFSWPIHIFQQKKIQIKKLLQLYSNAAALLAMLNTAWRKENNVLLWTLKKLNEFILCIFKIFLYKLLILADKVGWNMTPCKSKEMKLPLSNFLPVASSSFVRRLWWAGPVVPALMQCATCNTKASCWLQRTYTMLDRMAMKFDLDEVWNHSTCLSKYPNSMA